MPPLPPQQLTKRATNLYPRLSKNRYLHSKPQNFSAIVQGKRRATLMPGSQFGDKIIKDLEKLKVASEKKEKQFYDDLKVTGPKDFVNKYLNSNNTSGSIEDQLNRKIISVINSQEFVDLLDGLIDYGKVFLSLKRLFHFNLKGVQSNQIKTKAQLGEKLVDSFKQTAANELKRAFNESRGMNPDTKIQIKRGTNRDIVRFINMQVSNIGQLLSEEETSKQKVGIFKNNAESKVNDFILKKMLGNDYANKEETPEYIYVTKTLLPRLWNELANAAAAGRLVDGSSIIGIVLEMALPVAYKDWENIGSKEKNEKGQQSKSDLAIHVNGKTYKIQLKNSFKDNAMNVKIREGISYQQFIQEVRDLSGLSSVDEVLDELEYLIVNTIYLQHYGIETSGGTHLAGMEKGARDNIFAYTKLLLNAIVYTFLGQDYQEAMKENVNASNLGNLFYIYKGKYLIPISAYIDNAIKILKDGFVNPTDTLTGIQPITLDNFGKEGLSFDPIKNMWAAKRQALEKAANDTKDRRKRGESVKTIQYPDELVDVGHNYFQQVASTMRVRNIYAYSNLQNLQKIIEQIVVKAK